MKLQTYNSQVGVMYFQVQQNPVEDIKFDYAQPSFVIRWSGDKNQLKWQFSIDVMAYKLPKNMVATNLGLKTCGLLYFWNKLNPMENTEFGYAQPSKVTL